MTSSCFRVRLTPRTMLQSALQPTTLFYVASTTAITRMFSDLNGRQSNHVCRYGRPTFSRPPVASCCIGPSRLSRCHQGGGGGGGGGTLVYRVRLAGYMAQPVAIISRDIITESSAKHYGVGSSGWRLLSWVQRHSVALACSEAL